MLTFGMQTKARFDTWKQFPSFLFTCPPVLTFALFEVRISMSQVLGDRLETVEKAGQMKLDDVGMASIFLDGVDN